MLPLLHLALPLSCSSALRCLVTLAAKFGDLVHRTPRPQGAIPVALIIEIIIRIGFEGPLYYNYNKEPPKQYVVAEVISPPKSVHFCFHSGKYYEYYPPKV